MNWILGALGVGGIGAILFCVPGALGKAIELVKGLFDIVASHPIEAALIASLACNVWLWRGWNAADSEIAAIRAAQKLAAEAQAEVNAQPAIISRSIAEKSNNEAPAYYDRVRTIARTRIVQGPCAAIDPDLSRTDRPAEEHDGSDQAAGMVSVTRDDWERIVAAAARAAQMHADAQALIDSGVATASDLPQPDMTAEKVSQ